jgi:hypothetical protein
MRTITPLALLLLVATASAEPPAPEPVAAPAPDAAPAPNVAPAPAADALPDVRSQANHGLCEQPPVRTSDRTVAGADQYYWGELTIAEDGTVTGFEERLLFANDAWKGLRGEDGKLGEDCKSRWNIQGTVADPEGCRDCNLAIHYQADIDYEASTCPQRIVVDSNHFRAGYDFKKKADGTLEVFFSTSGNEFGTGNHRGATLNYISKHRCVWL